MTDYTYACSSLTRLEEEGYTMTGKGKKFRSKMDRLPSHNWAKGQNPTKNLDLKKSVKMTDVNI
mgnify:CR=1 FL=1